MKCVHATTLDNSLFLCMSNRKRCINKTGKNQKSARRERKFLAFTRKKKYTLSREEERSDYR